jgi:triacylglycerol lipase
MVMYVEKEAVPDRCVRHEESACTPEDPSVGEAPQTTVGVEGAGAAGDTASPKAHDLVLIHGLRNTHRWGRAFLERCLAYWGSGRVYVVYLNPSLDMWERRLTGGVVRCIGTSDYRAGTESIEAQAAYLCVKIPLLRKRWGLSRPFDVIAHSMGGLVLRRYVNLQQGEVAAAVTLGTPHGGAPMAEDFQCLGRRLRAAGALANLTPSFVQAFVASHPWPSEVPLYTMRGVTRDGWNWGVFGELWLGHRYHRRRGMRSDGLVPVDSAVCPDAQHLADFEGLNHLAMARHPGVVDACAEVLP